MNSKYLQNILYLSKCLHYSTNLFVSVFQNDKLLYSSSPNSLTASKVLYGKYNKPNILDTKTKYQIIRNEYYENYYIVSFYSINLIVIIGPFLNERINIGTITNMIRNNIVPFHKKTELLDYYKTISFFNEDRIFYTSKLIENIYDSQEKEFIVNNTNQSFSENKNNFLSKIKQNRLESFSHSSYINELKISETIKNGDTENAKKILDEINLTPHAKLAVDEIRSYKNSMICSCTFMTRAAINGGVTPNEAFTLSDTYINQIENLQNIDDLVHFEAKMVEGFTDLVNYNNGNKYSKSILNAINYIDKHLCEKIKISEIAKESYLNPSYLSNLFHKETSMTISDWIMRKRINEAAFSVTYTNESIADIAFFYNFCSQSYFVKCFKKIYGFTPGEYRKLRTKNDTVQI